MALAGACVSPPKRYINLLLNHGSIPGFLVLQRFSFCNDLPAYTYVELGAIACVREACMGESQMVNNKTPHSTLSVTRYESPL
ncbi:uncharacterized protein ARMOST_02495 [Armillaria ostoyae]|uniref:Uncharacterized protein n=1 Tax=Armillaria ostoyae TaxID=47428 RepID=A0A284QRU9_ARMOS|nr:uncharacterized protein ARMOST_02495 [Armillaria ostoyae]